MKNKFSTMTVGLLVLIIMIAVTACGGNSNSNGAASNSPSSSPSNAASASPKASDAAQQATDPDAEIAKLATQVLLKGPYGEEPFDASKLEVTDEDIQKLKGMKVTAAISLHYGGNDWSTAQVNGITDQLNKMGIKLIATTDANFKPEKQTADIETIMAKKPDILIVVPSDPVSLAPIYKKAAAQGIKVICIGQPAKDTKPGVDYVTVVGTDEYGNGINTAHLMARALGGKGKIAIIFHAADFPVTKARYDAFKKTIQDMYPNIEIVTEKGVAGPDFNGDAEKAAAAIFLTNPDVQGIWVPWDLLAEGVMAAARNAGRDKDLAITTMDLGTNAAIELAKGGMIKGIGGTLVYELGVTEAKAGALAVLGKEVPPFIENPGLAIDKKNLLEAWKKTYSTEPPKELVDALK